MKEKNVYINLDKELKEIQDDIAYISEKKPEMLPVLIKRIKEIRMCSESEEELKQSEKQGNSKKRKR